MYIFQWAAVVYYEILPGALVHQLDLHITALRWREQGGRGSGSGNSTELHSSVLVEKTEFSHLNSVPLSFHRLYRVCGFLPC